MKFISVVVGIVTLVGTAAAQANEVYIAQAAAGSGNGSSCANAYAYTYFNASASWTSATPSGTQIGPGSTVHLCGTITAAMNTEALVFQKSGTSGKPITLYFESGAVLESPEWPADGSGGAIDTGGNSFLVIDGNGGNGGLTQGIIEATSNGDPGATCISGTCQFHGDSNAIEADGTTDFTVQGLAIIDMYVATNPNPGGGTCIYDHGLITNWTITDNLMHDVSWCINLQYDSGTSSALTISNNEIYNVDHGIALGGPHAGNTLSNVNVFGNNIHDYKNWDTAADVWHHDGIHIWGFNDDGSDTITGVNIYDNKFGGCIGNNVTAHIFVETNGGNTHDVAIYNNTLIDTCNGQDNDGLLTASDPGYQVYNNTFIGTAADVCVGLSGSADSIFVNNIVSGCGTLQYITTDGGFSAGGLHNNLYANCGSSNCFAYQGDYTASFSTWQSDTGQDASPSTYVASAGLSAAGVPQSGSPAFGAGANLTSLALSALESDIVGIARPASGAWTIGAYSTSSGAPTSTGVPAAPTGLTATVL